MADQDSRRSGQSAGRQNVPAVTRNRQERLFMEVRWLFWARRRRPWKSLSQRSVRGFPAGQGELLSPGRLPRTAQ